jgi:gamma-butyrobetaine dioxygenase
MGDIDRDTALAKDLQSAMPKSPRSAIADVTSANRRVNVAWRDGHLGTYPVLWLRDNCTCDQCGDPAIGKRRLRLADISPDVAPASMTLSGDGDLTIEWMPDRHVSRYGSAWLRAHCPSSPERQSRRHRPSLWDGSIGRHLPEASYADVVAEPHARLMMYQLLRDHGLVLIRGIPPVVGELERFAPLFGPLVETNFGRVFEILWTPDQKSIANSTDRLMPHTDEPYRHSPPGIILFHCLEASNDGGGISIFVDGFGVAEAFRQAHPKMFDLLSRVRVPFRRHYAGETDVQTAAPLISIDNEGNLQGVRFNDRVMAPLDLGPDEIEDFYEAFRALNRLYYDERRWCHIPLRAGEMVAFDNHRVLHGRTTFSADIRRRHLRQCHVDRTEFHSRFRILARSLGDHEADLHLATGSHA